MNDDDALSWFPEEPGAAVEELSPEPFEWLCLSTAVGTAPAWAAKDRLDVKINQVAPPIIALTEGGSSLAQGTYSSSASIKVQYQLTALNLPVGSHVFGTFTIGLRVVDLHSDHGVNSDYDPALALTLSQPGSDAPQLQLSPVAAGYSGIARRPARRRQW